MSGFYQTPNKMVPLNDREPGEIADIAIRQLAAYQLIAEGWGVYPVIRREEYTDNHGLTTYGPERECNICGVCEENIWFTSDPHGNKFTYSDDDILALIVAHIRQAHPEVTTDV